MGRRRSARGIPDRMFFGNPSSLSPSTLTDLLIQRHLARRAGPHYDFRIEGPEGLYSWASRSPLPGEPGQKVLAVQQPVHSTRYKHFEGEIRSGYGSGYVSRAHLGKVLITRSSPRAIHFTLADKRFPERFVLIKPDGFGDKDWLLINVTPKDGLPYRKLRYKKVPAEQVDAAISAMKDGDTLSAKLDGASSLAQLLKDGIEVTSYRVSSETGRPIVHTEKIFHSRPRFDVPSDLVGTTLKVETYGTDRSGKAISPQALGGLLNSTLAKSIEDQKRRGVTLRGMIYDIQRLGKNDVDIQSVSRADRLRMIKDVLNRVPGLSDKLHEPIEADDVDKARELWASIQRGEHPLTQEGVVIWPSTGVPTKAKLLDETDVYVTGVFPGGGKYYGKGIGGLTYATKPGGPTVGRIGTGLSDDFRMSVFGDPKSVIGRVARIRHQGQFPTGAYRTPALLSLHEDYPTKKAAAGQGKSDKRQKVVAVDLDGTLAQHYDKYDASSIPPPRVGAKKMMQKLRDIGARIIIHTVRGDVDLVKRWLVRYGIPFDYINENPDQPDGSSDKLFADVYVDDRAVDANRSLDKVVSDVVDRLDKQAKAKATARQLLARAARKIREPTARQAEAGNYRKGHISWRGLGISIETPAGKSRQPEWPPLKYHYGYLKKTLGSDGDHVDVIIGPHLESDTVFVVNQIDPSTGKFDEHKCVIGARNENEARSVYRANYAKSWRGLGSIVAMPVKKFREWLVHGDQNKPAGELVVDKP